MGLKQFNPDHVNPRFLHKLSRFDWFSIKGCGWWASDSN